MSKNRRTSTLFCSSPLPGPASTVAPTPFSLTCVLIGRILLKKIHIPNNVVDFMMIDLNLGRKSKPAAEEKVYRTTDESLRKRR